MGQDEVTQFLNTRHVIYKERDFATKLPSRAVLIQLICAEPNLLRRPIVRRGKQLVIGFNQTALKKLSG